MVNDITDIDVGTLLNPIGKAVSIVNRMNRLVQRLTQIGLQFASVQGQLQSIGGGSLSGLQSPGGSMTAPSGVLGAINFLKDIKGKVKQIKDSFGKIDDFVDLLNDISNGDLSGMSFP